MGISYLFRWSCNMPKSFLTFSLLSPVEPQHSTCCLFLVLGITSVFVLQISERQVFFLWCKTPFCHGITADQRGPGGRSQICISSGSLRCAAQMHHQEVRCEWVPTRSPQGYGDNLQVALDLVWKISLSFLNMSAGATWVFQSNSTGWLSWYSTLASVCLCLRVSYF